MSNIFERRDASADDTTRYMMDEGDVFHGVVRPGKADWIAVTLVAGTTYSFGAVGLGTNDLGLTDPYLRLYDPASTFLATDDDSGPGYVAALTYTALTSGTYYLEVKGYAAGADATYGVSFNQGDRLSLGTEMAAAVLYRPGISWSPAPDTPVTLTWGVRGAGGMTDADGNPVDLQVLDATQIEGATRAFANYADVANITFVQVNPGGTTEDATLLIGGYDADDGAAAFANYPGSVSSGDAAGDISINNHYKYIPDLPFGSFEYLVYLHEFGHALGLDHPGDYNGGNPTYQDWAQFTQDSLQYTVMSYFEAYETEPASPLYRPGTLMMFDIYAVQQMYGVNRATRAGNDIYGFNSTVGGAFDFASYTQPQVCIWDGSGKDTLDLSGYSANQRIDLNDGHFSDVGGFKGNVSIAVGARIEKAIGGSGDDEIIGNRASNVLKGGAGDDRLIGGGGTDWLIGGWGKDTFVFGAGFGKDKILDFNSAKDHVELSSDLWGGAVMTAAQVLATFVTHVGGDVVLDFGIDELTFRNITLPSDLDGHLTIV